MEYTWRWFGPDDPISLADIRQAGATGVVSALHHLPNDSVWSHDEIARRKAMIEGAGLIWSVVESIPVPEAVKLGQDGCDALCDMWAQSALNLAQQGIVTICYNFMPVLDWTRTELRHRLSDGAECLRFDRVDLAVFDMFILKRPAAAQSYGAAVQSAAATRFKQMDAEQVAALSATILAGLPGTETSYSLSDFQEQISRYAGIDAAALRRNLSRFLTRVMPQLAPHGVRLAIHPDDPPRPILGLPRVVSTAQDLRAICDMYDDPANGLTFCVGSLGVRADNDLPAMLAEFGTRVHFLHLRNTRRDAVCEHDDDAQSHGPIDESFEEAALLDGDTDMVRLISIVHRLEAERGAPLPFRPDHGHALQSDLRQPYRPGYPSIGRLRSMAEVRGIDHALKAVGQGGVN